MRVGLRRSGESGSTAALRWCTRLALVIGAMVLAAGCSSSSAAPSHSLTAKTASSAQVPSSVASTGTIAVGNTASAAPAATIAQVPATTLPPVVFTTSTGSTATIYVEIADTPQSQEIGLMNRPSLPDNQGMIFIFPGEVTIPFWMKDTEIDLSIAFIDSNGTVVDIQEMQAETLTNHTPAAPYQYAIEANKGWYSRNGIQVGDTADVSQAVAASTVYGSGTSTPTVTP